MIQLLFLGSKMTRRLDARCPSYFLSGPNPPCYPQKFHPGSRSWSASAWLRARAKITSYCLGIDPSGLATLRVLSIPRSMCSPRALPDRCLSTQTWEVILARTLRSLSKIRRIYCGCAGFGQIFRSFSFNSPTAVFRFIYSMRTEFRERHVHLENDGNGFEGSQKNKQG